MLRGQHDGKEAFLAFLLLRGCGGGGGGGGELIGMKKLTNNHQSWKILKSVCDLAASAKAFCSKNVKLEDPVPDQPLHFP